VGDIRGDSFQKWGGALLFFEKNFLALKFGQKNFLAQILGKKNFLALVRKTNTLNWYYNMLY